MRALQVGIAVVLGIALPLLFMPLNPPRNVAVARCSASSCATASVAKPGSSSQAGRPSTSPHANPAASSRSHSPNPTPPSSASSSAPPASPPPVISLTGSGRCPAPSAFPVAYFSPSFSGPATRVFTQQYIVSYGSYVETCYPAGSTSPSSGLSGGAQARLAIARGSLDDATLTYRIRFPAGFTWVKGGKLPGLCGGLCWTGSNNGPGGWAARFMWRAGGAGEVLLSDATTTGYGSDLGLGSWHFQADSQWHVLSEHVHMNTPGRSDGTIDVTYNGAAVAHFGGLTFRTATTTHIDSLMFSTFFGGHDSTWAPAAPQRIDFAIFQLA